MTALSGHTPQQSSHSKSKQSPPRQATSRLDSRGDDALPAPAMNAHLQHRAGLLALSLRSSVFHFGQR
jgi:hypothetical protein